MLDRILDLPYPLFLIVSLFLIGLAIPFALVVLLLGAAIPTLAVLLLMRLFQ